MSRRPTQPAFRSAFPKSLQKPIPRFRLPPEATASVRASSAAAGAEGSIAGKSANPAALEDRLLHRATMGWTTTARDEIDQLGYQDYLERQLDYESLDDGGLEDSLRESLPSLEKEAWENIRDYEDDPARPAYELMIAHLYRAIYSPGQLFERMVVFWTDHFNVDIHSDFAFFLKPVEDREVIRRHALGKFSDLLRADARSPAMLIYLSNAFSTKEHPNENYARELMELHTLGADNGYTHEDVKEVARAFTGWTIYGSNFPERVGSFVFNPEAHDTGRKTVLGRTIPAGGGQSDGERVLQILYRHPNTARFLAEKMLRYFWGYQPSAGKIEQVAQVYLDTDGDIRAMLRQILRRSYMQTATPKLKRPFHLLTSAVRALGADLEDPIAALEALRSAGQLPFAWSPPNGYPDSDGYWSGLVLPRWNFASTFWRDQVAVDIPALDPERNAGLTRAGVRGRLNRQLLGSSMSGRTKTAVRDYLASVPLDRQSVGEAIGLVVSSPEFQNYSAERRRGE